MKKPQWITISIASLLVAGIFLYARTVPRPAAQAATAQHEGHQESATNGITIDTILAVVRKQLNPDQLTRLALLEKSISRGNVKDQQLSIYHQLAHFWGDSVGYIAPAAWYEGEAARLENSEKTLTFAAHLFLDNLQQEQDPVLRQWEALQAKDLFERSLKINPENDSSRVGLGATYLFGGISQNPMEGIGKIREVVEKDSTNEYALMTLAKGSIISGQLEKAVERLKTVIRLHPDNVGALLMLADTYERMNDKTAAVDCYRKSLQYVPKSDMHTEIEKRIAELGK